MIDLPEGTNLPREYREAARWYGADGTCYVEIARKSDRKAITFRLVQPKPGTGPLSDVITAEFQSRDHCIFQ